MSAVEPPKQFTSSGLNYYSENVSTGNNQLSTSTSLETTLNSLTISEEDASFTNEIYKTNCPQNLLHLDADNIDKRESSCTLPEEESSGVLGLGSLARSVSKKLSKGVVK